MGRGEGRGRGEGKKGRGREGEGGEGEGGRGGGGEKEGERGRGREGGGEREGDEEFYMCMVHVKKNATICKICAPLFDKKLHHTFMVCAGNTRIRNCGTFYQTRRIFTARVAALYKTAHCGAAIKVRHFWWEKSSAHVTMLSNAAAARCWILFDAYPSSITALTPIIQMVKSNNSYRFQRKERGYIYTILDTWRIIKVCYTSLASQVHSKRNGAASEND